MKPVYHWINFGLLWLLFFGMAFATTVSFSLLKLFICIGTYLALALYCRHIEVPH